MNLCVIKVPDLAGVKLNRKDDEISPEPTSKKPHKQAGSKTKNKVMICLVLWIASLSSCKASSIAPDASSVAFVWAGAVPVNSSC